MKLNRNYFVAILSMVFFANFLQAQTPDGFTWQDVHSVDFGEGANHFTIEAASAGYGGEVELRLDAADGPVIGRTFFHHTGDTTYFLPYECDLTSTINGVHDVYMNFLDYVESRTEEKLKIGSYQFSMIEDEPLTTNGNLHIYPPVPGLDPSPYYDIYIQKVSELNSPNLAEVTNWETPFAWFSQCIDDASEDYKYYSQAIGGWSHTYTNFELDPNTPIVVKIVRKDNISDGAPAGPISKAAVKPARNVDNWEVINGDVYITMSNPALVAVDIDGQLDDMVGPRAKSSGWESDVFPYNTKEKGAHSVSIFANPFIEDKPDPNDDRVYVVEAGKKIPDNIEQLDWDILYFEPGIHKTSVDANGQDRLWKPEDIIPLFDNKSYYIPGNAIVYGNFNDKRTDGQSTNVRIYGHGTISGKKIRHHKAWPGDMPCHHTWQCPLYVSDAENCHYQGITVEDPAMHTFKMTSDLNNGYPPNTIKWCKEIAWRSNSDALTIGGNVLVEDCFLRTQDDGLYIGGAHTLRRIVFWHDANGCSLRGDYIARRYDEDNASYIPKLIVHEDIDHIYERGIFITDDNKELFACIELVNDYFKPATYIAPGVKNTAQMLRFRNVKVSDPNPTRGLFSISNWSSTDDLAGIRFENMEYSGEQAFGWKKQGFLGGPNSAIRNFVFDNVIMSGEKLDQKYMDENFKTNEYVFDLTFRRYDTISSAILTSTATNGYITVDTTSGSNVVTLTATPNKGYDFVGWSGNLSGTEDSTTIIMDSDKSVTANFSIKKCTISVSPASNGTIVLEPLAESYDYGSKVKVIYVPDLGYGLDSWSGDLSGSEDTVTITIYSDKTISATVKTVPTYTIDIDTKYGSVIFDPTGGIYNEGTEVSLIPSADPNYYFEQWFGDLSGTDNPGKITMDSNKSINARFVYSGYGKINNAVNYGGPAYEAIDGTSYTAGNIGNQNATTAAISGTEDQKLYQTENWASKLSVNIPVDNGKYIITLMFAEIHFSEAGKRIFDVALEGNRIISNLDIYAKVGKNVAYNETHEVTISDGEINIDLTATVNNAKLSAIKISSDVFEGQMYTLTTGSPSNGTITADPADGPYPAGSNVSLTATPNSGFKFSGWTGDSTGTENPFTVYMDANKHMSAIFEILTFSLTINADNGTVAVNPEKDAYLSGSSVELSAKPNEGYRFDGWYGDLSDSINPVSIIMDKNKTINAIFSFINNYTLTTTSENGTIILNPSGGIYEEGTEVLLTAVADENFKFGQWSGDLSGKTNPDTIIMYGDKSVSALFDNLTNIVELSPSSVDEMRIYPNPITSEASIEYTLEKASYVELVIYNQMGQKVATLVNTHQNAGSHLVKWFPQDENGYDLISGIYICYLRTDDKGIQIKKASLIR